tara:strand:+ start:679 stop:921 length:243 start_codon:yes stop_codon:yes gene_type:complete
MGTHKNKHRTTTVIVKCCEVYLTLEGYYTKGEDMSHDYPGSASEFEIYKVMVEDTNIMDILHDDILDDLETEAINNLEDW